MKANKFFLGLALIGAILTGCDNGQEPETNGDEAKAYVSVRISMASAAGTRATDGGYEYGEDEEQYIFANKSIFLFYDAAGKWVTSGQLVTQDNLTDTDGNTVNPTLDTDFDDDANQEKYNDYSKGAYIVLSGPDAELNQSAQVLTVVNYSKCESLKNLNLDQALAALATDATGEDPADAGTNGFLMSTSVYVDNTKTDPGYPKIVNTTAISSANICQNPTEAEDNPVHIYIERASAKVNLSVNPAVDFGELLVSADKGIVLDGKLVDAKVTVDKWNLNNVYKTTYVVKKFDDSWISSAPFTGWNWADNKRSYWAMGHNYKETGGAGKYVRAYKDVTFDPDGLASTYCYENTVQSPECGPGTLSADINVNTVLIAATIQVREQGASTWEAAQNLYEYYGVFYREATYKKVILEQLKPLKITKDDAELTVDDITFVQRDGNVSLEGIKFSFASDGVYKKNGTKSTKTDLENDIYTTITHISQAKGYALGHSYYQIPVEHLGAASTPAQYGMVRNHVYKININAINNVGEPVFDPDVIIPEIPSNPTDHYLAAQIHILSWHIVNQSVNL